MAISRKDFIGALTGRPPRARLAGTLATLAHGVEQGAHIFRVHDVAAAADFLAVRAALAGESLPGGISRWAMKSATSASRAVAARAAWPGTPGEPLGW